MKNKKKNKKTPLPYFVIAAAANGDIEAINMVVKHYEAYITLLSTIFVEGENNETMAVVDDEKKRMLEIHLIAKLLDFRSDEVA